MPDDQRDVIDFLGRPSSYGGAVGRVDIIETHASLVFLASDRAYKLKRAVKYSYLDFSTAAQRKATNAAGTAAPIFGNQRGGGFGGGGFGGGGGGPRGGGGGRGGR